MFTRDKRKQHMHVCAMNVSGIERKEEAKWYFITLQKITMPCPSAKGKQKKRQKRIINDTTIYSYSIDFMCEISFPIALLLRDIQEWFISMNMLYLCAIMLTPFCFQCVFICRIEYKSERHVY